MRYFSPASAAEAAVPGMQVQHMVDSARVKINLPEQGDCWFFIQPEDSVMDFCARVQSEDPLISSLEVLQG